MADKIRLGESTVSGQLVRDPVQMKSRTGRQITMFRMTRVADQANHAGQARGLDEIDVTISDRSRIAASEYATLRTGDPVTVRGDSVIAPVKNKDGVSELRQHMVAKAIAQPLSASVAHFERPIPWQVREIDEDGSPRLHIPIEELENDPALTDELVDFVPDSYRFQDGMVALGDIDMRRRSDSHTENLRAAHEVSHSYDPSEIRDVLSRERKVQATVRVEHAIRRLPDPLSVVPASDRPGWEQAARSLRAKHDETVAQGQLAREITERYPLAQLAEQVDGAREGASVANAPGAVAEAQGVRASWGASRISYEHLMKQQDNPLPTRPGAQGPGL